MKSISAPTAVLITCLFLTHKISLAQEKRFEPPTGPASNAEQVLKKALEDYETSDQYVDALIAAARNALGYLPQQSPVAEKLNSALAKQERGENSKDFSQNVEMVYSMLTFQPRKEADLPQGFPTYTPVGFVEIKEYPAYRMAVAEQFWTLFQHIQSNNIAMTAPVEMTYGLSSSGELSQQSMAFLYGNVDVGELRKDGKVDVVDVGPLNVVAIGVRGKINKATVDRSHHYLMRWLEAHPDLEASGSTRVMGYNSPMVRQSDSFFEVQIPICKLPSNESQ